MNYEEVPFFFPCGDDSLLGIAAVPEKSGPVGVLVVVGGPQYRVGSHRQFVHLSRHLATRGIACMRFDCRGMGDSTGEMQTFEKIAPDVRTAIDAFFARLPQLEQVVLWGLCDGASAACLYSHRDARVAGLVLLNPWVRTEQSEAATYLRHYYIRRVFERDFWTKVFGGAFQAREAARSFSRSVVTALKQRWWSQQRDFGASSELERANAGGTGPLPFRMAASMSRFRGRILILLSGNDYTASEFKDVTSASREWRSALAKSDVTWKQIDASDHTLSKREWKEEVAALTCEWIANFGKERLSAA